MYQEEPAVQIRRVRNSGRTERKYKPCRVLVSYVFVAKFDNLGNEEWSNTYFQQVDAWPEAIEQTTDGGYIIGGTHQANTSVNHRNPFLIKTNWQCSTVTGNLPDPELGDISVYPNPSKGVIHFDLPPNAGDSVRVELFDAYGRKVVTTELSPTGHTLNVSHLPPGVYTFHLLRHNVRLKTAKIILL